MGLDNPIHIAFLLILLLLVFGAKRLPEMGRSLGDGMRGFKDAISGEGSHASVQPVAHEVAQPALVAQQPVQQEPAAAPSELHNAPVHTTPVHTAEKLTV
jgi:sec-independent protein translocase protein TatA